MPQRTWKSLIRWSTAVALVLSVPAVASAQTDNIAPTKHNLSATATALGITNYSQICVYCHTPHKASSVAPLWNRTLTADGLYTMYTATTSATMDMVVGNNPGPVSKACLSCHDGTIGLDVITNNPTALSPAAGPVKILPADKDYIGLVLTDDHPIAVTYSTAADLAFNPIVSGKVGVLPLYGTSKNQLECGTCHNVHNNTTVPFLRINNAASALCLTCHIK